MRCDFTSPSARLALTPAVSIPAGFSDALRLYTAESKVGPCLEFQSLLGFLMRCDSRLCLLCFFIIIVSIPAGFSDALRLVLL